MTNRIAAGEIERVRYIHSQLDAAVALGVGQGDLTGIGGMVWNIVVQHPEHQVLQYTAAEIRDWPKMKAEMSAMLRKYTFSAATCWSRYGSRHGDGDWRSPHMDPDCRSHSARGLCLYREMLEAQGEHSAPALVCGIDPATDAPDDFKVFCAGFNDEQTAGIQRATDDMTGARARLLAGLESERVKGRKVAHPHPGRCFELKRGEPSDQ